MNLSQIIIDIASLHLIRSVYHFFTSHCSDRDCYQAFVDDMNADSRKMGLMNSYWVNASGLRDRDIEAYTTAHDIAKMGIYAFRQGSINQFWNVREHICTIKRPYIFSQKEKNKKIISTIPFDQLGGKYKILGAKTGTGDGYNGLMCVCDIGDGNIISGAILDATSEDIRFDAMSELMDIACQIVNRIPGVENRIVRNAKMACAYLLDSRGVEECIFKQNADVKYPPMSLSKVLAFITLSKYVSYYDEWIMVKPFDEKRNDLIRKWSKLKISSLIYLSLLPSCCTASDVLARHCGNIILNKL